MLITLPKIKPTDQRLTWSGFQGSSLSCALHELIIQHKTPQLIITASVQHAEQLRRELNFLSQNNYPVLHFTDWETLPYDHFSPHEDIISERLRTLHQMPTLTHGAIICSITTLLQRLLPKNYLQQNTLVLKTGQRFDFEKDKLNLVHNGYRAVGQVMSHGEFAYRGSILDIFPMGFHAPLRIELFDDEIETIRTFDPETQRSIEKLDSIELLPAQEYPLNEAGITSFRQNWRERFSGNPLNSPIYQKISEALPANGCEYYLPLFYAELASIFDYLPTQSIVIFVNDTQASAELFWQEINERYQQLSHDIERPILPPNEIYFSITDFFTAAKSFTQLKLLQHQQLNAQYTAQITALPSIQIESRSTHPLSKLSNFLTLAEDKHILFCAESVGRRETLNDLLKTINCFPKIINQFNEFTENHERLAILVAPFDRGCQFLDSNRIIICESDLFGEMVQQRRSRKKHAAVDPDAIIRNLNELAIGSPIVHLQHGVGRYLGLETITTSGIDNEFLKLEYANNAKIYVPVSSLQLISRYTGLDAEHAPINTLGTNKWSREKQKAYEKIRDVAVELLEIYSKRYTAVGFAHNKPELDYQRFAQNFQFETTPDQQQAIDAVLHDMQQPRPMDRLVCGDVGFGKTEVAMRAAFLAVQSNKQVAVLVPTTLLATQHYENFQNRFADWPIKIALLSRSNTPKETTQIFEGIKNGKIDVVIATHKLLSENVEFKRLGLLVVDEEQRFGVTQKEKIKKLASNVDILTLTATPIPRTLNLALSGTRDLSIIGTPPPKRRSIKTFIHEYDRGLIREAVMREILRGGQVYFLHNKVETIAATAQDLRELLPEARIVFAHGQMHERELEHVMAEFYHQKFNVLVSTTIIESGIDIPTANTIIINRADKFGLAQLHQLRGRVGRSHHQAYAYLLTPPWKAITSDGKQRLEAFEKLGDLGVGFSLATHDLEIRGAGEILGDSQSGHIQAIGFSLYTELLSEAVKALKAGKQPQLEALETPDVEIKLGISALLPENYINDVHSRLMLYKRLSGCATPDDVQQFKGELIDRFGLLPPPAENLIEVTKIKLAAKALGIEKIELSSDFGYVHFSEKTNVNPMTLIKLIQNQPKHYKLQNAKTLRFTHQTKSSEEKIELITRLITVFSP